MHTSMKSATLRNIVLGPDEYFVAPMPKSGLDCTITCIQVQPGTFSLMGFPVRGHAMELLESEPCHVGNMDSPRLPPVMLHVPSQVRLELHRQLRDIEALTTPRPATAG